MTTYTEGQHAEEFLVSESNGARSRKAITITASQTLSAGHVIGQMIDVDEGNWTVTAAATGNGVLTPAATPAGVGAKPGVYKVRFVGTDTNLGDFIVIDPDGENVGAGRVGAAFSGPIIFTVADGATDFVMGDTITVEVPGLNWGEYDPTAVNGLSTARGILLDNVTTGVGETQAAVAFVRDCEVNTNDLQWFSGASAGQKTTALAELEKLGIIGR